MVGTNRRGIGLGLLEAGAAAAAVAVLAASSGFSAPGAALTVAVFAVLLFLADNAYVLLPSSASVSPAFMLLMAAIAALAGTADARGVVFGASLAGLAGGITIDTLRQRRYRTLAYNCSQYALSAAAAALVYVRLAPGDADRLPLAAVAAAAVYATVNVALVLPWVTLKYERRLREVWGDIVPALPNALAFGLLGTLAGQLYHHLHIGLLALPLMLIPAVVARHTFASYLALKATHEAVMQAFVRTIEAKDPYTAGHSERVARYAAYIGRELGFTPAQLEHLRHASLMHDIGKLAVPSSLLNKPGRLTAEEYDTVRRHNDVCIDILTRVDFLRTTVSTASDEHAYYASDPGRGEFVAVEAYVVAVADAFDAMTSTRSYRRALPQEVAFAELRDKAGTQFHPAAVDALVTAIERRGEHYGHGHEIDRHHFAVEPPAVGVGSAGLGDLLEPSMAG